MKTHLTSEKRFIDIVIIRNTLIHYIKYTF